jgi:D-beta-D-heptose 7-phosphate kinase/D-beta-D-heptose 1-phosphate adenosyltransferase
MKNIEELKRIVVRFDSARILTIGDVMLDKFIQGTVSRISPEAPVPVVDLTSETFKPGGAANAINNIKTLGADVIAAGVIGDDVNGRKLIDTLKQSGINTEGFIVIPDRPTTVKTRIMTGQQQIVRIDRERRDSIDYERTHQILDFVNKKIDDVDAILLSDYDKGVITNKLLEGLISLAKKYNKPIIVDPKIEHFMDYKGVTSVISNIKGASAATRISAINETSIRNMGQWILTQLECEYVLITRGKNGMTLFEKNGDVIHIPTVVREVYDVTGVRDTVTSVVALNLAVGAEMVDAATIANMAAGIVIGKIGTATVTKDELMHQLDLYGRHCLKN